MNMETVNGLYQHTESVSFVRRSRAKCRHCRGEMWVFQDSGGTEWLWCMASPAECGMFYPFGLHRYRVDRLVARMRLLRAASDPHKYLHELVS